MRRSREICMVAAIVIWFTALVFIFHNQSAIEVTNDERRTMNKALQDMAALQEQNQELHDIVISLKKLHFQNSSLQTNEVKKLFPQLEACKTGKSCGNGQNGITVEHEMLVRRSKNNLVEMWYAFERQLEEVKKHPDQIDKFKHNFAEQLHGALIDVEDLHSLNDEWRKKEAKDLMDLTLSRIRYLQNPKDCQNAKKLICNLNKACGFGCQLHHLAYCAMVAYGTERTLIIESNNWRYNTEGWEAVFLPASDTCKASSGSRESWKGEQQSKNVQNILLPIVDGLPNRPPYLPLGFPEDIGHRLLRLHGNPSVWWTGQFVHYLMRPQPWLEEVLASTVKESKFETPCVGYPDYTFYGDTKIAQSARLGSRYSKASLRGVLVDIFMLSKCDFLCCTFSSQVCRVAYELMQAILPDAADRFHSLDDIYYYGGQTGHVQKALYPHQGVGKEISFEVGDIVGIAGNHWDGYSKGTNERTKSVGLYPSWKVEEVFNLVKYPTFQEMKKKR